MSKPKVRGHRRGGRNAQFFTGLSGLARKIDAIIEDGTDKPTQMTYAQAMSVAEDKRAAAQAKRDRKNAKRVKEKKQ